MVGGGERRDDRERVQPLRNASPDGGPYLKEGDINKPDFHWAFWGEHYDGL